MGSGPLVCSLSQFDGSGALEPSSQKLFKPNVLKRLQYEHKNGRKNQKSMRRGFRDSRGVFVLFESLRIGATFLKPPNAVLRQSCAELG